MTGQHNHTQESQTRGEAISFSGKLTRVTAVIAVSFFLILLLWFAIDIPLLFFAGVVAAAFIRGMSAPLSGLTRLPHAVAAVIVILALCGACWLAAHYLAPHVGQQLDMLKQQLPAAISNLQAQLRATTIGNEMLSRLPSMEELLASSKVQHQLKSFFSVTLGVLADGFIIFFAALYLIFAPEAYLRGIVRLVPKDSEQKAEYLFAVLGVTLRRWILGRLTSMAAVGLITGIGLWVLGVPLALTLGLLSALLTFIPYIGAVISSLPAVLLALLAQPVLALWVVCLYLAAHGVEAYIVTPLMQQHQVEVPPVLTLMVQIMMIKVAGMLGMMLATPVTAMVLVMIKVLYVEDALGKKVRIPGAEDVG